MFQKSIAYHKENNFLLLTLPVKQRPVAYIRGSIYLNIQDWFPITKLYNSSKKPIQSSSILFQRKYDALSPIWT